MEVRTPRSSPGPARRGAHLSEENGLPSHAHRPALARLTATPREKIAAEIDERVLADLCGEPIRKPSLCDPTEVDRCALSQSRGGRAPRKAAVRVPSADDTGDKT